MAKNNDCIAIYSRKSKFTGKGESIGNQVELCREYIRAHEGEAAAEHALIYEDEGFSGGNLNRPDFKKMMASARKHEFRAIIVYRLDRISRNINDFSRLIEELSRLGIAFVSIREQFDTETPMGRAMMYIASVFSQLERETIAERIRDNMRELAKTGRWLGGNTPIGYVSEAVRTVTMDGKAKKTCKLKVVEKEKDIVQMIFHLYLEYDSLTITEAELIRRGIKTRNGKHFTRFSIKAILQNPVYMTADQDAFQYFVEMESDLSVSEEKFDGIHGMMVYDRTDQEKGRTTRNRPVREWIVAVGEHPGFVKAKNWIQVQNLLERNKAKNYRRPRSNEALLTGQLYCCCGSRMYPKLTSRKTADGKPIYTYICNMKQRSQRNLCGTKNVNGNALDAAVMEEIKMLEDDRKTFIRQLEESRKFYIRDKEGYEGQLTAHKKEKEELEKKMESLIDSLAELKDRICRGQVEKRMEKLGKEMQDADLRIRELEELVSRQALCDAELDMLSRKLCVWKEIIDSMTVEQKRAAVRTLVDRVVWDGKDAILVLFGSGMDKIMPLGEGSE